MNGENNFNSKRLYNSAFDQPGYNANNHGGSKRHYAPRPGQIGQDLQAKSENGYHSAMFKVPNQYSPKKTVPHMIRPNPNHRELGPSNQNHQENPATQQQGISSKVPLLMANNRRLAGIERLHKMNVETLLNARKDLVESSHDLVELQGKVVGIIQSQMGPNTSQYYCQVQDDNKNSFVVVEVWSPGVKLVTNQIYKFVGRLIRCEKHNIPREWACTDPVKFNVIAVKNRPKNY